MAFNIVEFVSITTVVVAATTAALILPLKKSEAVQPEAGSVEVQQVAPVSQPVPMPPPPEDAEAKVQEIEQDVKEAKRDLDEIKVFLREKAKENDGRADAKD